MLGNPSVILIDEYSTGIDAKMKRELWEVLKQVTSNKSVLLTTRECQHLYQSFQSLTVCHKDSMEEASYLATKVGIISQRMLGSFFLSPSTEYPTLPHFPILHSRRHT